MPWPTPTLWVADEDITAAALNARTRDQLIWLKAALDLITNGTVADSGTATYLSITRPNEGGPILVGKTAAGTHVLLQAGGAIEWFGMAGAPGTIQLFPQFDGDSHKNRLVLSHVATDKQVSFVVEAAEGDPVAGEWIRVTSYAEPEFTRVGLGTDASGRGRVGFGDGVGPTDTIITRDQAYRTLMQGFNSGGVIQPARFGVVQGAAAASETYSFFAWADGDTFPRVAMGRDDAGLPAIFFGPGGAVAPDTKITRTAAGGVSLPMGVLGYVSSTSSQTGITTEVALTGMSLAVTTGTSRRIRISGKLRIYGTAAADVARIRIKEGAGVQYLSDFVLPTAGANGLLTVPVEAIITPSAGAHTYTMTIQAAIGTSVNTSNGATFEATMLVEDLGPA